MLARHSQRVGALIALCLAAPAALAMAGCADSGGSGNVVNGGTPGGVVGGGQTGSLIPTCALSPAADSGPQVLDGGGVVFFPMGCPAGFDEDTLLLRDANGEEVETEVEELDTGAVLVRAAGPVEPGVYTVESGAGNHGQVTATEAPEPRELGTLSWDGVTCNGELTLELSEESRAYAGQLRLSVSTDGAPWVTWFEFGTLDNDTADTPLLLPSCPNCVGNGEHDIRVRGELAGDAMPLPELRAEVTHLCAEDSAATCSSTAPAPPVGWLAAMCWLLWRRRARPPAD